MFPLHEPWVPPLSDEARVAKDEDASRDGIMLRRATATSSQQGASLA
jgi:hypothetical protein